MKESHMTDRYANLADAVFLGMRDFCAREFSKLFDAKLAPLQKKIEETPSPSVAMAVLRSEAEKIIAEIPKPLDGKPGADGKSVTIEEVSPLVVEEVAKAVAQIPPAKDGQSVSLDDVRKMVQTEVAAFVATIQLPRDGRDGQKGDPGRDALQIVPLSMIELDKSYPRGTYASHNGGLWYASRNTKAMEGWECMVDGQASVAIVQDPEDPRHIGFGFKSASGTIVEKEVHIPFVIDKGVYKEGVEYKAGDGVTWARNYWIAQKDTTQKPDFGGDFRLAVKGGRDGKDGRDGIDKTAAVKL